MDAAGLRDGACAPFVALEDALACGLKADAVGRNVSEVLSPTSLPGLGVIEAFKTEALGRDAPLAWLDSEPRGNSLLAGVDGPDGR